MKVKECGILMMKTKVKYLTEKIILEEPEDEVTDKVEISTEPLPDAVLDEPIKIDEPIISDELKQNSFVDMLSGEISDVYSNISALKSVLTTLGLDLPERTDVQDILNEIINERTMHVGMLQKAIDLLNEEHKELLDAGEEKAEQIASEPANELNKEE